jgi:hypothetical protein
MVASDRDLEVEAMRDAEDRARGRIRSINPKAMAAFKKRERERQRQKKRAAKKR